MTAMAMSPQYAALSLLQTQPALEAVLASGRPVRFSDLYLIAAALAESPAEVRYLDRRQAPPDRAFLAALRDSLRWLGEPDEDKSVSDGEAGVLVVDRKRWQGSIVNARARTEPFPAAQVVAAVLVTPDPDRLIVVPTVDGGELGDTAVMLYGRHRAPGRDRSILRVFARVRGMSSPVPVPAVCELSDDPAVDCVGTECRGRCVMELAYESRYLVKLGCICH